MGDQSIWVLSLNLSRGLKGSQIPEVHCKSVSTSGDMYRFAAPSVHWCACCEVSTQVRDGPFGRSGGGADRGMAWKTKPRTGKTKVTNNAVTGGIPRARLRAGGRRRGLRARAARCGGPDAVGASSTTRGRGRSRRTPRSSDYAAWLRGRVRKG